MSYTKRMLRVDGFTSEPVPLDTLGILAEATRPVADGEGTHPIPEHAWNLLNRLYEDLVELERRGPDLDDLPF